jgi:hypothetical protein
VHDHEIKCATRDYRHREQLELSWPKTVDKRKLVPTIGNRYGLPPGSPPL